MTDEDLKKYLPCKGDRIAAKAFARGEENKNIKDERKFALIESLRKRMGVPNLSSVSDTDDKGVTISKRKRYTIPRKCKTVKQAEAASKPDRALVVGFAIYEPTHEGYRQIRAPLGGGIRYPRVNKDTKKDELIRIITPLFFPGGKNCHGKMDDYTFDISTDVHGAQLMQDESIEDTMLRLGLKHFRCYLLARCQREDSLINDKEKSSDNVQKGSSSQKPNEIERRKTVKFTHNSKEHADSESDSDQSLPDPTLTNAESRENADNTDIRVIENQNIQTFYERQEELSFNNQSKSTPGFDKNLAQESGLSLGTTITTHYNEFEGIDHVESIQDSNQSVLVEFIPDLFSMPSTNSSGTNSSNVIETTYLNAHSEYESDNAGRIQFARCSLNDTEIDKTIPMVCQITVHRGRVCRDLIDFFSRDNIEIHDSTEFEINMLKEDGTPEAAEDNGGVMRDALTEFWDTFYLQYTEGNAFKVPVLRHDMTEIQWKSVAFVIRMGFIQEKVYPIKLVPSFMQQAIFGACIESDLIHSFLKFVSVMNRNVLERALKDFEAVDKDELFDALEQYDVKQAFNSENIKRILREVAHKELVQKPMFIADSFFKVLNATPLVQEDLSVLYSELEPTPKKVLSAIKFPEEMSSDEKVLSQYLKRLVREMDDPQNLQLFLRFCTGSDIMTKNDIQIRFTSSSVSSNVRCPSSHTCGCVLEIPRSYFQDPYVLFKSDFLSLLRNRYWQMDFV
ncbi:uncharacterized protein LOC111100619 isoform X2 [Crassostrea virginica]